MATDEPKPKHNQFRDEPTDVERDETINEGDDIDEASYETFPASDPPAWSRGQPEADDEKAKKADGDEEA